MTKDQQNTQEKEPSAFKKFFQNKYVNVAIYSILNLLLILWSHEWWLIILFVVIFDFFITKKVNRNNFV